jgi:high-affinity Fe2+/Pb2+ permease
MIEPSFFYGAMYVSYGLTVAIAVAVFIICYLFGLSLVTSFVAIVITLIVMTPILMRLSRLLYINMFVHFDKKYLNNGKGRKVDSHKS